MVNVIGLGYIGLPTALMMASHGVEVVGTDYNKELVATLNRGEVTFEEKDSHVYVTFSDTIELNTLLDTTKMIYDYEKELHKAIQHKKGLNVFDAIAKAMKAKKLDVLNKSLYKKVLNFAAILYEKGVLTEEEANKIKNKHKFGKYFIIATGAVMLISATEYFLKMGKNDNPKKVVLNEK